MTGNCCHYIICCKLVIQKGKRDIASEIRSTTWYTIQIIATALIRTEAMILRKRGYSRWTPERGETAEQQDSPWPSAATENGIWRQNIFS